MNIREVVNQILTSYTEEDKRPCGDAMCEWDEEYFNKLSNMEPIYKYVEQTRAFQETSTKKEDFELFFKTQVDHYINPISFGFTLKQEAIDRIIAQLEPHLRYTRKELQRPVLHLFRANKPQDWNFDSLCTHLLGRDPKRYKELLIEEITGQKKISA